MQKRLRVFLDTSALLAGFNSPTGAAGAILADCAARAIIPVIAPQVIEEVERIMPIKFPRLTIAWASFLLIPPEITSTPTLAAITRAYALLPTSDAPILASALAAKPDALITWNTRDFMRPDVVAATPFPILRPGEFLHRIR